MSNGKGDKDRTKNRKAYSENYDLIDFNKKDGEKTVTIKVTHKLIPVPENEGEGQKIGSEFEAWANEGGK